MLKLTGLHFLLTYQCTFECDHCFVWGSPRQSGTFTLSRIKDVLEQAKSVRTIKRIYFEGGESFLYYPILLKGVQVSDDMGFQVGIVSNGYWATSVDDATEWLRPFAGLVQDLSISSDLYHYSEKLSQQAQNACKAAEQLGIPAGVISIARPDSGAQRDSGEGAIMFRGRAVEKLVAGAGKHPWTEFTTCPYEDLRKPGRVHVDPFGNLHVCQGISLGNLFQKPLAEICATFRPGGHPIIAPLLKNGPVELVQHYKLPHTESYADACHLCYESRKQLRQRFPEHLLPGQMYGED